PDPRSDIPRAQTGLPSTPDNTKGLDPYLAAPVMAGLCGYVDIRDRLSLDEVADLNEGLLVRAENDRRRYEAMKPRNNSPRRG
ncbi:MAG: hypothetical protein OXH56_06635, partial [Gemmatimonadetes bacterium]|nr:hypothetical protein [Gemmatimonadota bacterium]